MLTQDRLERIEEYVNYRKSASIAQLAEYLDTSESTVRRDLFTLDDAGKITKVHGGARSVRQEYDGYESNIYERMSIEVDAKRAIGRAAAALIGINDAVYLDAGTSVGYMLEFISPDFCGFFVTNYTPHAKILGARGFNVAVLGGELRFKTGAFVGVYTVENLKKFNFAKGFFGVNGIGSDSGYTTSDLQEGAVKGAALSRCEKAYVLADSTKFDSVRPVSFGTFAQADIITDRTQPSYDGTAGILYA